MADSKKTMVLAFKTDAKDAIAGAKGLRTAIGDILQGHGSATNFLTSLESLGTGLTGLLGPLGDVIEAIGSVTSVVEKAVEKAAIRSDYLANVGTETFQRVRGATRQLIPEMELLRITNNAMHGEFALTARDLEMLGEVAVVLHRKYLVPTREAFEKLTRAVSTGSVESLKEFGIIIEGTKGPTDASRKALDELRVMSGLLGDTTATATESLERLKHTEEGFFEPKGLKKFTDEAARFQGAISDSNLQLAEMQGTLSAVTGKIEIQTTSVEELTRAWTAYFATRDRLTKEGKEQAAKEKVLEQGKRYQDEIQRRLLLAEEGRLRDKHSAEIDRAERIAEIKKREAEKAAREAAKPRETLVDQWAFEAAAAVSQFIEAEKARAAALADAYGAVDAAFVEQMARANEAAQAEMEFTAEAARLNWQEREADAWRTFWDDMRLEVLSFDDTIKKHGVDAFHSLARSGGEAMNALITGQADAGETIKNALHDMAEKEAIELWGLGIKGLVMGGLDLFWNPAAAASEFGAAAVAFSGAATLSALAGVTTPEEPGASGASGGGRTSERGAAASAGNTSNNITVQIGSGFWGDRKLAARELKKTLNEIDLTGAGPTVGRSAVHRRHAA
jgi:hypothetical protein